MQGLGQTFTALGDETRRAILAQLLDGETPVSQLAKHHEMTLAGVSNHVRFLREAGLVTVEKRGRTRHCRLNPEAFQQAAGWLEDYRSFWVQQIENMDKIIGELDE